MPNNKKNQERNGIRLLLHLTLLGFLLLPTVSCNQPDTFAQDDAPDGEEQQLTKPIQEPQSTLSGKVIRILDGDTIEILDTNKVTYRIRLQGIDAPEKTQAFGNHARQQLSDFVFNHEVLVQSNQTDIYGRTIGKVLDRNQDICLKMIQKGLAWHFKRYANTQSEADRSSYSQAEEKSRQQKLGLWADPNPLPPWSYRRQK